MPIDTTPSTVATTALQNLPFSTLIGGPLDAAIKAEAQAAQTSWEFIKNVGLTEKDGEKRAVTVDFIYTSNGREVRLVVPLLAIVPIPYISIDNISIDFKANIAASSSSSQENTTSENIEAGGEGDVKVGWGPFSADIKFHANYSSKKDSRATQDSKYSVEYTMDVHVGASQADMPAGLAAVLNILQSSITPTLPEANLHVAPKSIDVDPRVDKPYTVNVTAFDEKGLRVKNSEITVAVDPCGSGSITINPLSSSVMKQGTTPTSTAITLVTDRDGNASLTISVKKAPTPATGTTIPAQSLKVVFNTTIGKTTVKEQAVLKVPELS